MIERVIRDPSLLAQFRLDEWELLIRQARASDVLARVGALVRTHLEPEAIPPPVLPHFDAAETWVKAQHAEVRREAHALTKALSGLDVPIVVLKGGGYILAGLAPATGRTLTDIDILVPKASIPAVEAALMLAGWHTTHHDDYDQRYYREWMHEIPPMMHATRATVVDVHHGILPITAHWKPDPRKLLERIVAIPGWPGLFVLGAEDRILHAATHLLSNEELSHGLRDLWDIHLLVQAQAIAVPDFWTRLLNRAQELNLMRLLAHALRHAADSLGTDVPLEVLEQAHRHAGLSRYTTKWMHFLWRRGLACPHSSARLPAHDAAQWVLYARAHALRMPTRLLFNHIVTKAWKRVTASEPASPKKPHAYPLK